jgi:hypothetical protein
MSVLIEKEAPCVGRPERTPHLLLPDRQFYFRAWLDALADPVAAEQWIAEEKLMPGALHQYRYAEDPVP